MFIDLSEYILENTNNINIGLVFLIILFAFIIAAITKIIIDLIDYKKFVEEYYHTKINTNIFKIGLFLLRSKLHQKQGI